MLTSSTSAISTQLVEQLARECGFELAGVTPALPLADFARFEQWREQGLAGEMTYLTDRRGDLRADPRNLLPEAKSIVCVGKLYNTPQPFSATVGSDRGWISRYAWGDDYHSLMRKGLEELARKITKTSASPVLFRVCVDTAPLLERSYARAAGLGWIGKNMCLINQEQGSWFFLGALLLSIPLTSGIPPPDRCGTCHRCIDACPTTALEGSDAEGWRLDARRCISYLTIEKRGQVTEDFASEIGNHVFGCDICQEVCPWNRRAPESVERGFEPQLFAPPLAALAALSESEFRAQFRHTAIWRAKYSGLLRNVAIALGNANLTAGLSVLEGLAAHPDETVARAARQSLARLQKEGPKRLEDGAVSLEEICGD